MLNFHDWSKKDKKDKGYTITKSRSGLPLFILDPPDIPIKKADEPKLLDDEPAKKKEKTIPQIVADVAHFISAHNK